MSIVAQFSWDDIADPAFENPTRKIWRDAVAEIAEKAKATLPECNGRVDRAVKLVLAGDVELLQDGTAKVYSQSHGTTQYVLVNGECPCKDYSRVQGVVAVRGDFLIKGAQAYLYPVTSV